MSRIRVGLIRRIGHCVSVCTVWRHLVAAGYRSRHPDRCPSVKAAACWHTGARLEPSALVSTDIYWWAQGQPLNCNGCAWMFCHVVESLVDGCLRESGDQSDQRLTLNSSANITCNHYWCFQFCWRCTNMSCRWRLSEIRTLGHLSGCLQRYSATIKRLWAMQTKDMVFFPCSLLQPMPT